MSIKRKYRGTRISFLNLLRILANICRSHLSNVSVVLYYHNVDHIYYNFELVWACSVFIWQSHVCKAPFIHPSVHPSHLSGALLLATAGLSVPLDKHSCSPASADTTSLTRFDQLHLKCCFSLTLQIQDESQLCSRWNIKTQGYIPQQHLKCNCYHICNINATSVLRNVIKTTGWHVCELHMGLQAAFLPQADTKIASLTSSR